MKIYLTNEIEMTILKQSDVQIKFNEVDKNNSPITMDYIHAATRPNTRLAYQKDIRHFIQWGGQLPITTESVLQYLHHYAGILNPRTLARRLTALKQWHRLQGFIDPSAHPATQKILTGIRNVHGKPRVKAAPLTLDILEKISATLQPSSRLIDCRNRAILLVGFFGAFRRSELANILWENINFVPEGIEILIPHSKTDPSGGGEVCAIPQCENLIMCPVAALKEWQCRSKLSAGAIFRQISKGGELLQDSIKPAQINLIIKSLVSSAHLPHPESYSAHSLRRGFATEASKSNAPFGTIMRHGRWRHEGTVLGYIEEGKRFDQNAASIMLNQHETKGK